MVEFCTGGHKKVWNKGMGTASEGQRSVEEDIAGREGPHWAVEPEMMMKTCVYILMPTHCTTSASGSTQGGQMALGVVYFQITHRLGRPHYVWDEYLYSVLEKVEVRVTVCETVCVV